MPVLEKDVERKVVERCLKCGILSTKLEMLHQSGFPDRIFWLPGGKPLMIEFKTPAGRISRKQAYIITTLRDLGYKVIICRGVKQGLRAIHKMLVNPPQAFTDKFLRGT